MGTCNCGASCARCRDTTDDAISASRWLAGLPPGCFNEQKGKQREVLKGSNR